MSFKEEIDKLVRKKQEKSERENAIPWMTVSRSEMRGANLEGVPRKIVGKGQGHFESHSEKLRRLNTSYGERTPSRDITSNGDFVYSDGWSNNMKIQPTNNLFTMKPNVLGKTNNQFKLQSDIFSNNMTNREEHQKAEKDIFGLRPIHNQPRLRSDGFSRNMKDSTPQEEEEYRKMIAGMSKKSTSDVTSEGSYKFVSGDDRTDEEKNIAAQIEIAQKTKKEPNIVYKRGVQPYDVPEEKKYEVVKTVPYGRQSVAEQAVGVAGKAWGALKQAPQQFKRVANTIEQAKNVADVRRMKELESLRIRAQLEKTRAIVNYHQAKAAQLSGQGQSRIGGGMGGMSLGGGIGGGIGLGGGFSGGGQSRDPLALPSTGISMGGGMSLGPSREQPEQTPVPSQGVQQYRPIRAKPQQGNRRLYRKTGQYSVKNPDYKPKVQWRKVKYVDEKGRVIAMMVPKEPRDSTIQELESRGERYGY